MEAALHADVTIRCPVKGKSGCFGGGAGVGATGSPALPGDGSWQCGLSDLSLTGLTLIFQPTDSGSVSQG